MKGKLRFKHLTISIIALLFALNIALAGGFTSYAAGGSFSNYWLSSNGGVKASYNNWIHEFTISGAGTVDYDRWVAMAQKIDADYFASVISWDASRDEDMMEIVFEGEPKAIKLPGTEKEGNGLFTNFSGKIYFNDAVDLAPDVTDTSYMFADTPQFNEPVDFDTSNVTNMSNMFYGALDFNQPVNFDTSKVTNMSKMFQDTWHFNQPVNFDTSNVKDMSFMFDRALRFNQPVNFDTSKVTDMSSMFRETASFNQPVDFDTRKVINMYNMFWNAKAFNYPIFFDISSLDDMSYAFKNSAVEQVILSNRANNKNINAQGAFENCYKLYYLSFSGLKDASIAGFSDDYLVEVHEIYRRWMSRNANQGCSFYDNEMYRVFTRHTIEKLKLSADGGVKAKYDTTSKVLNIYGSGVIKYGGWVAMAKSTDARYYTGFHTAWSYAFTEDDLKIEFNGPPKAIKLCGTEKPGNGLFGYFSGTIKFNGAVDLAPDATDLSHMFHGLTYFNEPVAFDTSNVTNMSCMFYNAKRFNQPVDFDTSNATNMSDMFACAYMFNQPVDFDTSNVTNMSDMFYGAYTFNQPVNFDTSKVTNMSYMFRGAEAFKQPVDFDISSAKDIRYMFDKSAVEYITLRNSANNKNIDATGAFTNCKHLKELSFSGLKNAEIDGFSGDYYVSRNGSRPTAHNATEPYEFTDNQSYRVSLRSSIRPRVTASKQDDRVVVKWTPVTDATGYEVYGAFDKAGPFRLISTTRNTSQTYYASDNPFYQRQYLGELPCYYKVRAFIKNRDIELYGPFSEVTGCLRGIQPIDLNDRLGR